MGFSDGKGKSSDASVGSSSSRQGRRGSGFPPRHASFSPEEDRTLLSLLQRFPAGTSQVWAKVAALMPDRTGKQCRDR